MVKTPVTNRIADIPTFGLRLPPELKKRLEDEAQARSRSLNAEITARLERSLTEPPTDDAGRLSDRLALVENAIASIHLRVRKVEGGPPRGAKGEDLTAGFGQESAEGMVELRTLGIDDDE